MIRPKHHRMQHIPLQILRDKLVLDAWIIERLHLLLRDILGHYRSTSDHFESNLLAGVCLKQSESLKTSVFYGLDGTAKPLEGFPGTSIANSLLYCGLRVSATDVVWRENVPGLVRACADERGTLFVLVDVYRQVGNEVEGTPMWRETGKIEAWLAEHIEQAMAWYDADDGVVILR